MYKYSLVILTVLLTLFVASCTSVNQTVLAEENGSTQPVYNPSFLGEKGENVNAVNGEFLIDTSVFQDNLPRFYNVTLPNGKMVFFFAVKDSNGSFHIAANACQVCSEAKMGFHAEEGMIVCNVCGNRYPIEKIATEKGGCNPVPVTPQAEIREGKIVIKVTDLEKIADYF